MSDIVLVSMPFGPVFSPSLALSLLKAGLARHGLDARLQYFTITFAETIGQDFYCRIANGDRPVLQDLTGEWLFSHALFETTDSEADAYVEELLRDYYSDALIARIWRTRAQVAGFLDECAAAILRDEPQIVGFTSVFQQHVASLALARRLKAARPSLFIVFGGANCENAMGAETVRSFPFVDAAVSGEADLVFPDLVTRVLAGESLAGLAGVRTQASVKTDFAFGQFGNAPTVTDMDSLPRPDYADYFEQFKASRYDRDWSPTLFLETARGCWWGERMHCTFCGLNGATMAFRSKSAERALAEVTELVERYPGCDVQAVDNILDMRYFKDFIPALAAKHLAIGLYWETKSNLTRQQVRLLRDAGIREIQPGIESFSDSVLKLMHKGVSGLQNIQLLKWCKEYGVHPKWNVLWGFPGESADEYARLATVVPWITHLDPPVAEARIRLDRFSPNFFDAERLGFTDLKPIAPYRHIYKLPDAALANLACYFSYEYREPRNVDAYVRPFAAQIARWKQAKDRAAVLSVDTGDHLVLIDLRPAAVSPCVVLAGLERTLYRECDAVRDLWQLAQLVPADDDRRSAADRVEAALAPLVDRGLVLRDGSRYLALAIALGEYTPPPPAARKAARVMKTLGIRRLAANRFSVDARGRLAIQASARSGQRHGAPHGKEIEEGERQGRQRREAEEEGREETVTL